MKLFGKKQTRSREPTAKEGLQMLTTWQERYYVWNGRLYDSDIVRACIRPKVKAIGKLVGKHIRNDPTGGMKVNPDARIDRKSVV